MSGSFLPIELEATVFLIDADLVHEVLGAEPWLPVPRARPELPGVVAWRGRAVPLVDLGRALGLVAAGPRTARARTLIVHHERGVLAIPVDSAREVRAIPDELLREAHVSAHPYAARELDEAGTVMAVIDLETLLVDLESASGEAGS
jgi:chemotaxis signal transduction protein